RRGRPTADPPRRARGRTSRGDPGTVCALRGPPRPGTRGPPRPRRRALLPRTHRLLSQARHRLAPTAAGRTLRVLGRPGDAARHLPPLGHGRRKGRPGADRFRRALLLADDLLPDLSALHPL